MPRIAEGHQYETLYGQSGACEFQSGSARRVNTRSFGEEASRPDVSRSPDLTVLTHWFGADPLGLGLSPVGIAGNLFCPEREARIDECGTKAIPFPPQIPDLREQLIHNLGDPLHIRRGGVLIVSCCLRP